MNEYMRKLKKSNMRKIILLLMLIISCSAFAQNNETYRVYCELLGTTKFLSLKVNVSVDFGQDEGGWASRLVDENGKAISFNSMVDAMNYMGKFGWKFEQAYVVTSGQQNVYHWLLSKDISKDEIINEGFNTRQKYNDDKKNEESHKRKKKNSRLNDDVYN